MSFTIYCCYSGRSIALPSTALVFRLDLHSITNEYSSTFFVYFDLVNIFASNFFRFVFLYMLPEIAFQFSLVVNLSSQLLLIAFWMPITICALYSFVTQRSVTGIRALISFVIDSNDLDLSVSSISGSLSYQRDVRRNSAYLSLLSRLHFLNFRCCAHYDLSAKQLEQLGQQDDDDGAA